jgi:hypothetical protein
MRQTMVSRNRQRFRRVETEQGCSGERTADARGGMIGRMHAWLGPGQGSTACNPKDYERHRCPHAPFRFEQPSSIPVLHARYINIPRRCSPAIMSE